MNKETTQSLHMKLLSKTEETQFTKQHFEHRKNQNLINQAPKKIPYKSNPKINDKTQTCNIKQTFPTKPK